MTSRTLMEEIRRQFKGRGGGEPNAGLLIDVSCGQQIGRIMNSVHLDKARTPMIVLSDASDPRPF